MLEPDKLTLRQLVKCIKDKKISCQEVMAYFYNKLNDTNPVINAVVQQLDKEAAYRLAKKADEQIYRGKSIGKLHGLPFTVKDHIRVQDFIVTMGSMGLKNNRCPDDASIVGRLKKEGAIVIGITNMPEFGPAYETDNDIYGKTNNPYDLSRTAGGSSGGEGAILACGGSAFGIGSDAGGSVRIPAHFCGITGIKPTQHLVPCTGNALTDGGLVMKFGTFGPMARHVEDLELILPIISGSDGIDPYCIPTPYFAQIKPISELKVGFIINTSYAAPTEETVITLENAVKLLRDHCSAINEVNFLDIGYLGKLAFETFFLSDQGKGYSAVLEKLNIVKPSAILQNYLEIARNSEFYDAFELRRRFFEMDQLRMLALQQMQEYDVLLTPVCATPAKYHETTQKNMMDIVYTLAFNLLGWPAAVVRCGQSNDGLPIGLQIIAKPWHDFTALSVAKFLEQHLGGWHPPHPPRLRASTSPTRGEV